MIAHIKSTIPGIGLSSDFISGFCGETEEDHNDTLSLLQEVGFDQAFMFAYSRREKTHAHRNYVYVLYLSLSIADRCVPVLSGIRDDVPEEVKQRRLSEVIATFHATARVKAQQEVGKTHVVLVEGVCLCRFFVITFRFPPSPPSVFCLHKKKQYKPPQ